VIRLAGALLICGAVATLFVKLRADAGAGPARAGNQNERPVLVAEPQPE
jgi:hypothetical protein